MNHQTMIEHLQETIEEQRLAISQISHEIRNPVTLINSSLQLIQKEHPEVKDFAFWKETMQDMQYLIHLLGEVSNYNNGAVLTRKTLDTTSWLKDLVRFADTFVSDSCHFFCMIPDQLPALKADDVKLRQAITNLLRNAFEAVGSEGDVSFSASASEGQLCLSIKDTGNGIPAEYQETIFQPFITYKSGGTGLGLPITKRIIESHQGTLSFETKEKQGTVFTIRLPL